MDKFRPQYHFTPPRQWMNDPNGLVFFQGLYHLFYQHDPDNNTPRKLYWGHAVSEDLVHWEHRPVALHPDEHGLIFSGSAVVDWEDTSGFFGGQPGLVAIFTHHDRVPGTDRVRERQSLAYSTDAGVTWVKYSGNPVLADEQRTDFRDPKVFWHEDTKRWAMIVISGRSVSLYHSGNLKDWTFASEFGGHGLGDGVWECPDLFPLAVDGDPARTKWVMIVSIGGRPADTEGSRTQYFIGSFDGQNFVNDNAPETVLWLDHGRDNYAGVSWSDIPKEDGRRICLGWMSNQRYCTVTPTEGWRSAMTVPRTLALGSNGEGVRLIQKPVQELQKLRTPVLSVDDLSLGEIQSRLSGLQLASFELIVELASEHKGDIAVQVRTSASQQTVIGYASQSDEVYIDRTLSGHIDFGPDFAGTDTAKLASGEAPIKLHLFVDRCSVELFANDGEAVVTNLIFPDPEATGLGITASEDTLIRRLEIYKLD